MSKYNCTEDELQSSKYNRKVEIIILVTKSILVNDVDRNKFDFDDELASNEELIPEDDFVSFNSDE